jgi:hypothetical protein
MSLIQAVDLAGVSLSYGSRGTGKKSWNFEISHNNQPFAIQLNCDDEVIGCTVPPFCCSSNKGNIDYVANIDNLAECAALENLQEQIEGAVMSDPTKFGINPDDARLSKTMRLVQISNKSNKEGELYKPSIRARIDPKCCSIIDNETGAAVATVDLHKYNWISMIVEVPTLFVCSNGMFGLNKRVRSLRVTKNTWIPPVQKDVVEFQMQPRPAKKAKTN